MHMRFPSIQEQSDWCHMTPRKSILIGNWSSALCNVLAVVWAVGLAVVYHTCISILWQPPADAAFPCRVACAADVFRRLPSLPSPSVFSPTRSLLARFGGWASLVFSMYRERTIAITTRDFFIPTIFPLRLHGEKILAFSSATSSGHKWTWS